MEYDQDKQELIDRYLLGGMEENEQADFEKQLAADAALREEVELARHIMLAIENEGDQAALEAMQSIPEEQFRKLIASEQPAKSRKRSLYIRISTAAAAIALLLLYIGTMPRYSPEQLFSQYYQVQPYETFPIRGGSELTPDEKKQIQQAKIYYGEGDYPKALSLYDQLFAQKQGWKPLPEEVIFHSAICRLETGNLPGAIEQLHHIASGDASDYQDEAVWNLAFAYLKNNQRNKAKACLNKLIEQDSDYAGKARELQGKLNEKKWF